MPGDDSGALAAVRRESPQSPCPQSAGVGAEALPLVTSEGVATMGARLLDFRDRVICASHAVCFQAKSTIRLKVAGL